MGRQAVGVLKVPVVLWCGLGDCSSGCLLPRALASAEGEGAEEARAQEEPRRGAWPKRISHGVEWSRICGTEPPISSKEAWSRPPSRTVMASVHARTGWPMGLPSFTFSTAQEHRSLPEAVVNNFSENRQAVCVGGFVGSAAVELPLGARSDFEPTREDEHRWAGSPTRPRVRPTQWGRGRWAHLQRRAMPRRSGEGCSASRGEFGRWRRGVS